uniref:Uncharacterized protein n=1 Tax=uncultured marine Nitrospinaceae bacterium TaxID=482920 RepID=A4GJ27_9BACT|nr:hypothetical protein [uncultured marine Nitrospinaceae bacterium]
MIVMRLLIFLGKSGQKGSDEYNHFWRYYLWERSAVSILKFKKLKQSVCLIAKEGRPIF